MSTVQETEKEYTVLMTFPVNAVHKTTVWASSKDEAESLAAQPGNEWELEDCDTDDMVIGAFPEYEVEETI